MKTENENSGPRLPDEESKNRFRSEDDEAAFQLELRKSREAAAREQEKQERINKVAREALERLNKGNFKKKEDRKPEQPNMFK